MAPSSSPTARQAKAAQAQTLEGLLLNHPLDCPVCDKAGECLLQDFSYDIGHAAQPDDRSRRTRRRTNRTSATTSRCSPTAASCVRAASASRARSPAQAELQVINRGDHSEIDIFPGEPLDNKLATNVVDLCPVGALCSKDFLYKQRVWNLKTTDSVCPDCTPAAASTSTATRTSSIACGRARTRKPRATSCATRAGWVITTSIPWSGSRDRSTRARRKTDADDLEGIAAGDLRAIGGRSEGSRPTAVAACCRHS